VVVTSGAGAADARMPPAVVRVSARAVQRGEVAAL
jgi:hypothetical protein